MKSQSGSAMNFGRALLISLLLHALLLWQPPPSMPSGRLQSLAFSPDYPLSASLRARPEPQPLAAISPAAAPAKASVLPQPLQQPPARQAAEAPRLPQAAVTAGSAKAGEDGLDANGLRQYRLSLAVAARRYKLYPPLALENGWSGTAEVAVAIAASGAPQPAQLLRSSGYALLDAAAMEMMARATLNTAVPASLQGQHFSIALPVEFAGEER